MRPFPLLPAGAPMNRITGSICIAALHVTLLVSACAGPPVGLENPGLSSNNLPPEIAKLMESLRRQTRITTGYTQKYFVIGYPNGDVPEETGACTDVVIRAFRNAGVDLQKEVHEDMKLNFSRYPAKWGLHGPDTNIDHRRVPNLMRFFERKGRSLGISDDPDRYLPGDVVTWDLNGKGMTHIGIVSDRVNSSSGRPMIYHNIGGGTRLEDRLFAWEITGRYRYFER